MKKCLVLLSCLLFMGGSLFGQQITVTGTVTSATDGESLPGVTVQVQGTTQGTVTDMDGEYSLPVAPDAVLIFSFIGMDTQEVPVEGREVINVAMEASMVDIEEFVVVGYGVQRKREVTGSITSVQGDDIARIAAPSFDAALAGRSSGVQVTTTSGVLGAAPRIRIRGIGSVSSGTYPLIVVDGVPVLTGNIGGYAQVNALGDINPNDIESIEILKDGSATAIYGSRAANGVILITTKRGEEGQIRVNYNAWAGVAQPVEKFPLTNEAEFITIANEMFRNAGQDEPAVAAGLDTDWQGALLRDAFQHDHSLNISGATSQTSYYFSLGFGQQEGVTRPNEMERYTLRANVEQKANDWLSLGTNASLTRSMYYDLNRGSNSLSGNIFSAIRQLPNTPIYDPDDPTGYNIDNTNRQLVGPGVNNRTIDDNLPNIMYVVDHNNYTSKILRTIANAHAQADIMPGLTFRTQLGIDLSGTEGHLYWNPLHGDGATVNGRIYNTQTNFFRWNWQNVLSYLTTFGDVHNINATLVNEYQHQQYNYFFAGGTGMSSTFFRHNLIGGTYDTQLSSGSMTENGFISYAGRLNYNYDQKYFLQGSIRYDGISSLPEENRWGLFTGGSVGWTISREDFMQDLTFIDDLQIRASYAEVGNTSIGNYPFAGLYGGVRYGPHTGIAFVQMGNDLLKWETSKKFDVGLDLTMLDGKYQFTFDYFLNDQDGLILAAPTPASFGVPGNSIDRNIGELRNWGYEFSAEAHLINTTDLSFTIEGNLSLVENRIDALVGDEPMTYSYYRIAEGESIRSIYGYDYVGVNEANGNPIYRKADGTMVQGNIPTQSYAVYNPSDPTNVDQSAVLTGDDRITFGPSMPTYYGSITPILRYRQFDMNAMLRFSGGNYIMNRTRADLVANSFTNYGTELLNRWQSPEEPGDGWTPKLWYGATNFINIQGSGNGRFVEKGDFLKLSNLEVGYSLPPQVLARLGVDRLRLYVQATDLFMITDYTGPDPEMESAGVDFNVTPRQRTFTMGINLSL